MPYRYIIYLILAWAAGAAVAHARYQPAWNAIFEIESQEEEYRSSAVIGYVRMDWHTKELYFDGKGR